ncbi:hypothetical protein ISN76_10240 [Dyella halodurans]|uniref:Surface-adhesin E family protein n=1 Tax=Dyella halodurans TaxID=1920171 RepID=A0ABV9C296_9GAMM|nr:surface-adhesin E family protein [Dyella halodurans]
MTSLWTYDARTVLENGKATGLLMTVSMESKDVPGHSGIAYNKEVARLQVDCKQHTASVLENSYLDSTGVNGGSVVQSGSYTEKRPVVIVPESMLDKGIDALCQAPNAALKHG